MTNNYNPNIKEPETQKEERKVKKSEDLLAKIDKAKRTDTKKMIKILSIIFFLITIILMTVAGFAIDKNFNVLTWISNSAIIMGIMVFGMIIGESLGEDKQKEIVGGLYQTALGNYKLTMNEIGNKIIYFYQWFATHKDKELEQKKIDFLSNHDINHRTAELVIKCLEKKDIDELRNHPIEFKDNEGKISHLDKIDDDQYELILYALKIKFGVNNAGYFMSALGNNKNISELEKGAQIDKQIKFNKNSNRFVKIGFSLLISFIFGLFAVEQAASGNTAQVWVTLASRIAALFGSLASGWMSAVTDIRLKAEKINNKISVLKLFFYSYQNNEFKPLEEEDLAKQKYEEYKKKEEEAKANVITPEPVVDMKSPKMLKNESNQIE